MLLKLKRFRAQLAYLPRALQLVWYPAPVWSSAWAVLLVIKGVLPAISIYLTRVLVDSLVDAIASGSLARSLQLLLWPAALMGSVMMLSALVEEGVWWIETAQSEVVGDYIQSLVHSKSVEADLGFYESPEYHDRLEQTQSDASEHPLELMQNLGGLIQNSITAIATITVLLPYGLWLPTLLIVSALPSLGVVLHFNRRYHRWWNDTTTDRRWADYYSSLITDSTTAAELRLFNLGPRFQSAYQALRSTLRSQELSLLRDQAIVRLLAKLAALLTGGLALVIMLRQSILGILTLGDLALFYQAFNRGQALIRSLMGNAGQVYRNSLFLENLFEFLEWKPTILDPPSPISISPSLEQGIRFRQVTFRYPGSQTAVLENFDLTIPAGQTIAIVGDNGAGKSTLLKLLCRFYDPDAGAIEIDGVDIRALSLRELRDRITVLFQSPVRYRATAAENIAFGRADRSVDIAALETAATAAGAHEFISQLPYGYRTLLSKAMAEGVELSGGEWQRVALARAFLRQAPIVVLDEPTSAMDPWSEIKWLKRFCTMVSDRTAIMITHRFTAAMRADYIYLMQRGEIVEAGTHDELLAKQGFYAKAWAAQTQASPQPLQAPSPQASFSVLE